MKTIIAFFKRHSTRIVDKNAQKFRLYPRWIIWLILFLSYNVLAQGVADLFIKFGGYTPLFEGFPARWDFLFLTAVSVLMGYQVLMGMRRRELDVTRNSFAIGILVEAGLVISDIIYVIQHADDYAGLLAVRMPFIILTFINFLILVSISHHLKLFKNRRGEFVMT